jgi:hypothetical protein
VQNEGNKGYESVQVEGGRFSAKERNAKQQSSRGKKSASAYARRIQEEIRVSVCFLYADRSSFDYAKRVSKSAGGTDQYITHLVEIQAIVLTVRERKILK